MTTVSSGSADSTGTVGRAPKLARIRDYLEKESGPVTLVGRAPGNSHDGWIFKRTAGAGEKVLVRLDPEEGPFLNYDGRREAALMRHVGAAGIPVPSVLAYEGPEVCGAPFLVLEWIDGEVLHPRLWRRKVPNADPRSAPSSWASSRPFTPCQPVH